MNRKLTDIRRTAALILRLAILVAGLACFLCFPWDTPLVAGRVGCLILGVRIWVVGLALLATAAVWAPDEFAEQPGPTREPANPAVTAAMPSGVVVARDDQGVDGESSHLVA